MHGHGHSWVCCISVILLHGGLRESCDGVFGGSNWHNDDDTYHYERVSMSIQSASGALVDRRGSAGTDSAVVRGGRIVLDANVRVNDWCR